MISIKTVLGSVVCFTAWLLTDRGVSSNKNCAGLTLACSPVLCFSCLLTFDRTCLMSPPHLPFFARTGRFSPASWLSSILLSPLLYSSDYDPSINSLLFYFPTVKSFNLIQIGTFFHSRHGNRYLFPPPNRCWWGIIPSSIRSPLLTK